MMRCEFDNYAKEFTARIPDEDEYKQIEFVYNWYPVDLSKEDIARIWAIGARAIITDMMERAIMASNAQKVIDECREKIRRAEIDLKFLRGGEDVKEDNN